MNKRIEQEADRCWKEIFQLGWSDTTRLTLSYNEHKAFAKHYYDLALTPESIKKIVSIADDMIKEGENCGFNPPEWYGTESFYDEVLRRFNDEN